MRHLSTFCAAAALAASCAGAGTWHFTSKHSGLALADDPALGLRPGLKITCRVKFDRAPGEAGQMNIINKGGASSPGCYILRVDGPKEGCKFSFFVNTGNGPEPRVSVKPPDGVATNVWYDITAAWDGTNATLAVNGQRASVRRAAAKPVPGCVGAVCYGSPLYGTLENPVVSVPPAPVPARPVIAPGFSFSCKAEFLKTPKGETSIAAKEREYLLRYDVSGGAGAFNFFAYVDGSWEPRASLQTNVETGRVYSLCAGWDGLKAVLTLDGTNTVTTARPGRCKATDAPLRLGSPGRVRATEFAIRNDPRVLATVAHIRTRELMPRLGEPAHVDAKFVNIGEPVRGCSARARLLPGTHGAADLRGVSVTPDVIPLPDLDTGAEFPLAWRVDAGTNGLVRLEIDIVRGNGEVALRTHKRFAFMPDADPPEGARGWNPPVRTTRAFHIDADGGDDARDGLTPATAWRTFKNATGRELGPGERLLLKRGCVFNEALCLSARGAPDNWAEIGAYGEGMRPQIRRNRHLNDFCGLVSGAAYLAVRDLVFCNAGAGFSVRCEKPEHGHVLVERCLAHHIEGMYRFNSHGIPEWRDEPGPVSGVRSYGISVAGGQAKHTVLRDCESYQCSSGFQAHGTDSFVTRMFCHDNFAHNTSPHPYNLASRAWMTDCVFDASGWHAAAGTMGVMLAWNAGLVIRNCHFLNQPDSGSPDQGGIDFEAGGDNCRVENCTFRNNAGAAIEVLGLRSPQTYNVHITGCKFDRNNWAFKNGPAEIQVWGSPSTPDHVACSNGRIENNGCVLVPGVPFYTNATRTAKDWILTNNRTFDFAADLDRAFPYTEPPAVTVGREVWTDRTEAALEARVDDPAAAVRWEQIEGPAGVAFADASNVCTKAVFPGPGDYRVNVAADNGTFWRTARTAVHILPPGARTFRAWDFAKNLDMQGWRVENTGMEYEYLVFKESFWNSKAHPVRFVCGDYLVTALKDATNACLVTRDECDVGAGFSRDRTNAVRIRMQNHTTSRRMRLSWQQARQPAWDPARSVTFDVTPNDPDDTVYTIRVPPAGDIKQLKLDFSADGAPVTGTCRIDYIWLGSLP